MSNHYHLLVETPGGNLVTGMKWLQGTYTARFNARHRQRGHVFQGRYKAIPMDPEEPEYARVVSDYIHLNPARAGLVNASSPSLKSYAWSSFPAMCSGKRQPIWLKGGEILMRHGWSITRCKDRIEYERYLQKRAEECWDESQREKEQSEFQEDWHKQIRRGWYLGGEAFRERLEKLVSQVVSGGRRSSYCGEAVKGHDEQEAEVLLERGLRAMGLSLSEARKLKQNDVRKQGLAWLIKAHTVIGDEWIQKRLAMGHRSNVSRAVRRYRDDNHREINRLKRSLLICTD